MTLRHIGLLALLAWLVASCSGSGSTGPSDPPPVFTSTAPSVPEITVQRGASVVFEVEARGPNGEPVSIQFRVNQLIAASSSSYLFTPPDTGRYRIEAIATLGSNTATHTWTVVVVAPTNTPPLVQLTTSTLQAEAGVPISASVTAQDTDGSITSVAIDFDGDGVPEESAFAASLQATHSYPAEGTYTIRVTATDNGGATGSLTRTVTVVRPNQAPTGSLDAHTTTGDGPLDILFTPVGADADGTIAKWELDAGTDGTWVEIAAGGPLTITYPYSDAPYLPRLRLTDDRGGVTIVEGPAITVFRPVDSDLSSSGLVQGNPWFNAFPSFAPAIFADGNDRMRFAVIVRDHGGTPISDVPVRLTSLRPELVSPNGDPLGETVTISIDGGTAATNVAGTLTGAITSKTSGHVMGLLGLGSFAFDVKVEAYAGHGVWRPLPQMTRVNIETTVSSQETIGQVQVFPAAACVNVEREIRIRGFGNSVSPNPGQPVAGAYADVRYPGRRLIEGLRPGPGYDNWRTGGDGWIILKVRPTEAGSWIIIAYVDGVALNIPSGLFVEQC